VDVLYIVTFFHLLIIVLQICFRSVNIPSKSMPKEKYNDNTTDLRQYGIECQKPVMSIRNKTLTLCQLVMSIFLLFIFVLSANSQTIPNSNAPINDSTKKVWREYIFSDAPQTQRLNLAIRIASRYYLMRDYASSLRSCLEYLPAFEEEKEKESRKRLQNQTSILANYLITRVAQPEDFDIFQQFCLDNRDKPEGISGLKMYSAYYTNIQKWDSAAYIWKAFKKYYPKYQGFIDSTIDLLLRKEQPVRINNYGNIVNSTGAEWDPNISPDGNTIYYSAVKSGGFGNADIWYSERSDSGWTKPQNLGATVNSMNNETVDNISPDGNTLFISGDFEGTFGKFDIYTATKDENGWTSLKHFPMPINSEYQDEACNLTADGNVLIFSSDRKGGVGEYLAYGNLRNGSDMGNMDIWVSEKQDDGYWGEPINLGESINTPFAERAPYLHPDGKTLYFSSNAHPGFGKLDVYKSTRLSDTSWTEWSKPINLGKNINTVEDDWGYVITASGDSAVFAARNRTIGYGNWDLYSVSLPDKFRPNPICTINGNVRDINGKPLKVDIVWEDLQTKKTIGKVSSDPRTGKYFINLPLGKFYGYYAEKDGYYPISNNVNLINGKEGYNYKVDITMVSPSQLKNDETIELKNIFFDYDDYSLRRESEPELDRISRFLAQNKELKLQIEGHTDNNGTQEYNQKLSEQRAKAIKEYLVKKGISANRLKAIGYGDSRPAYANVGEQEMSKNRRVEIRIID
jgi:outer membrane protein OmpA-like peptidoglycan-associated protein/Tol biopolymer transport system component